MLHAAQGRVQVCTVGWLLDDCRLPFVIGPRPGDTHKRPATSPICSRHSREFCCVAKNQASSVQRLLSGIEPVRLLAETANRLAGIGSPLLADRCLVDHAVRLVDVCQLSGRDCLSIHLAMAADQDVPLRDRFRSSTNG